MVIKESNELSFLVDGGEMGRLMREKDWSKTPIGEPASWPQSLRLALGMLLNSRFPMFVWWGPELITFYNDAYIQIAGEKHPSLLGKPGPEAWAEIWPDLEPLVSQVMQGTSTWSEDQLLNIYRHGYVEETYFTFSYSPIRDESGKVAALFCACIETTEKVLAARKITESERNLRNTILQSPVAMCILRGPLFHVEIANDRMYEMWGKDRTVLEKRPLFEGLPEAREQGFEELLQQVYTTGITFSADERPTSLPRNGGVETVYINFVYEPFRDGDGSISGVIAVAIDVTPQVLARKKIEESEQELQVKVAERTSALEEMNQALKRTNINLEEFAYAASHDLKEPIRKIHFFSERLKEKLRSRMTDDERSLFERMEKASSRMGLLVDDLLAYSQVTNGVAHVEPIDLNKKIQNVLEDLELEIADKTALIQVDELPHIHGHKRQVQQVFQNLISNALKYSKPQLPPVIHINATTIKGGDAARPVMQEDADKQFHLITVKDNGIGFEKKDADRIFNVFTRLHGNSEYKGTGVGLSIVRKVIENHHGYIWADSVPGEGSEFSILLPAEDGAGS